jgi:hypothetical protein
MGKIGWAMRHLLSHNQDFSSGCELEGRLLIEELGILFKTFFPL